jgi:hypothetical protein
MEANLGDRNDLQLAAVNLRKPHFPAWDIPDLEYDASNPNINMIPTTASKAHAIGFQPLVHLGLTSQGLSLLEDVSTLTQRIELYCSGTLIKPNLQPLLSKKNELHHALLSLPTAAEAGLSDDKRGVYEVCRMGGLLYSSAVLYPLPVSTGTLSRLVDLVKAAVQDLRLETCFEGGGKLLVWTLMLGGIAAEGTLERPWFLRRLKYALSMEKVGEWDALKVLVTKFLWLDSAIDDGAWKVWEELEKPPFL